MANPRILIVVNEFHPSDNIGAYRWSKLTKYLMKLGAQVTVICSENENRKINQYDFEIIEIPLAKKPCNNSRLNYVNRLSKKLSELYFIFKYKTYIQDSVATRKKVIKKTVKNELDKDIYDACITSGPPHMINFYIAQLFKSIKNTSLIIDIRDLWTEGIVYGMKHTPLYLRFFSKVQQNYAFRRAHKILVVNDNFKKRFQSEYPLMKSSKLRVIPHCFDLDDYSIFNYNKTLTNKYKFIYGGRVITEYIDYLEKGFFQYLRTLELNDKETFKRFQFDFYGNHDLLEKSVKKYGIDEIFNFYNYVNRNEFNTLAKNYNFCLGFLGNSWKDYIITKLITYLPLNIPIVLISEPGMASEFVSKNNLGIHIEANDFNNSLIDKLNICKLDYSPNPEIINEFNFSTQARNILDLIK
jgi:hypothetical protein